MSWLFGMAIECGFNSDTATSIINHFKDFSVPLSNNMITSFSSELELETTPTGKKIFWVNIYNNDFLSGGGTPELDSLLDEIGLALYNKLKTVSFYRFAIVGIEVLMSLSYEDIYSQLRNGNNLDYLNGVVIENDLEINSLLKSNFKLFSKGYQWLPYDGSNK